MAKVYTATVQISVEVETEGEACDWISGLFEFVTAPEPMDWEYVKIGPQYLYPTATYRSADWSQCDV